MDEISDLIAILHRLHGDLLAALAAEDHLRCQSLLGQRDGELAALAASVATLGPADRDSWQPELQALAHRDRELLDRFATVRDDLGSRLAGGVGTPAAPRADGAPGDHGELDRRA